MPQTVYSNNNDPFLNGFARANFDPSVGLNVNYNNYYKGLPVFNTAAFSDPGFKQGNEPRVISQLRNPFNANVRALFSREAWKDLALGVNFESQITQIRRWSTIRGPAL